MKREKTGKGQPLMRNYVKYALTQLELTMEKEKKREKDHQESQSRKQLNNGENSKKQC